ncbi:MAG: Gldg family protein, partial [Clostridia bacterium]|nr:Gldg family protein [Clostridia bacterium]
SATRDKVIKESEIYTSDYTDEELMYYQMMGYNVQNTSYFNGEQMLTSALDYVTLDVISAIYYTTGHGEAAMGQMISNYLQTENYTTYELSLITTPSIPQNASVIIINNPATDISGSELQIFKDYIDNGGNLILISDDAYDFTQYDNLNSLTQYYAMNALKGSVVETDGEHYFPEGDFMLPVINAENEITAPVYANYNSTPLVFSGTQSAFTISDETREGLSITKLITTSESAYTQGVSNGVDQVPVYYEGECVFGAIATVENGGNFVWYSSADITDDSINSYYQGGVLVTLLSVQKFCNKDSSVSLAAKQLSIPPLTVDSNSANFWGTVIIVLIPLTFIIIGLIVWGTRRRK